MTHTHTRPRAVATIVAAVAAASIGGTAGYALRTPNETPRSVVLAPPPGRGLDPPWWESITVQPPPPGTKVVTFVVPSDVLFATDSATVDTPGRLDLMRLVRTQLQHAKTVMVAGATDSRGTRAHNLRLSQARANAAATVLIAAGVDARIVRTEPWADDHPVADEHGPDPATARARNRRVVIEVTN